MSKNTNVVAQKKKERPPHWVGKEPRHRCLKPSDLPTWVKHAIRYKLTRGSTWAEVCEAWSINPNRMKKYLQAPAAKIWRDHLAEQFALHESDPAAAARAVAANDASFWFEEGQLHYRAAKDAGDLAEAGRQLRQMQEIAKLKLPPSNVPVTPLVINVTMGGGVEIPMGESNFEVIKAEVIS